MRSVATILATLFAAVGSAHAQYDFGPPVDYHALNSEFTQQWTSESFDDGGGATPPMDADGSWFVPPQADRASYTFEPDAAVREDVRQQMISAVRLESPDGAREFASVDVFGLLGPALRQYGLELNNLADAMTLYASEVYQASRREELDLDRARAESISRQMAVALDSLDRSPVALQRASDKLALQSFLIYSERTNCAADQRADCSAFHAAVEAQAVDLFGAPADQVTLTENGFAIARLDSPSGQPTQERSEVGECGFPVREKADRDAQMLLATVGGCSSYSRAQ